MNKKILLKDILFNEEKVTKIAKEIHFIYPKFDKKNFIHETVAKFVKLELKDRISWIANSLKKYLPNDYKKSVAIILKSLPKPNNPELEDNDFGDFIYAPYSQYVAQNGCNENDLYFSLNALYEITKRFSAEYAIRYFINAFPKETLKELEKWSKDKNYHIRRLACEGTRHKLPWAQKINISVDKTIPILNNLFYDKTRYVTRSVANHLNDISKIDANFAIKTLANWQKSKKQNDKEMDYIIKHSLRSLLKNGDENAMKFLDFLVDPKIEISDFKIPKNVKINDFLEFSFDLKASENVKIIVNYAIYFCNKARKIGGCKIFKIKNFSLKKNERISLAKKHFLKENMTTKKIFKGEHFIEIKINGKSFGKEKFLII